MPLPPRVFKSIYLATYPVPKRAAENLLCVQTRTICSLTPGPHHTPKPKYFHVASFRQESELSAGFLGSTQAHMMGLPPFYPCASPNPLGASTPAIPNWEQGSPGRECSPPQDAGLAMSQWTSLLEQEDQDREVHPPHFTTCGDLSEFLVFKMRFLHCHSGGNGDTGMVSGKENLCD